MTSPSQSVEIHRVRCRARTASEDIAAITLKNGRPAIRSVHVECGARKFRIGALA